MSVPIPNPISVFIADDHRLYVEALSIALENSQDYNVRTMGTAADGRDLLTKLKNGLPDILLLDLNMPVMNGLEVLPVLRKEYPNLRILIVTNYSDAKFVKECLQEYSVAGYFLKSSGIDELINALHEVLRGNLFMSKGLQLYPRENGEEAEDGVFSETFLAKYNLTKRELEILGLIAQAKSNAQIADHLFISPQTVGAHRKNIMRKLNISSTAGLVRFAIENLSS